MRAFLLFLLLMLCAAGARAEALAPSLEATGGCLAASVMPDRRRRQPGALSHRLREPLRRAAQFLLVRENSGATVPAALLCPRGRGVAVEPRHAIVYRKEFQWHLPRGSRIRFHDCPGQEHPTADFGCSAP
jgi:hypothetical protein